MKVLVVGSGGREHALVWALERSDGVAEILAAPGNGGMAGLARCVDVAAGDVEGLLRLAREEAVDLTLVGPEDPLAAGIVDRFRDAGLTIFGPSQAAAQVETSKAFAKEFMARHGIPTARSEICTTADEAWQAARQFGAPVVVKASGLAAGKGVTVCPDLDAARRAIEFTMVERRFGDAGSRVVMEECLQGEELSILAVTDGRDFQTLVPSQDHKAVGEGDTGPNTGGMGAYSPVPSCTPALRRRIETEILAPCIHGLAAEGTPYSGILYAGLMLTDEGPMVIEFNARFGDPEAQVVIPRLESDILALVEAGLAGTVAELELNWTSQAAACVVMASGGYPRAYDTGYPIRGLAAAQAADRVMVFHAGTARQAAELVTAGGRVLGVTALGPGLEEALASCYQAVEQIDFEGAYWRADIGHRALSS